jgi:hypothetical protein
MGTAQPAGRIRRRQHRVVGRIGVGNEGGQGGGTERESWGSIAYTTHGGIRVPRVFFDDAMCVLARMITPQKSMVHPPCTAHVAEW